MHRALASLLTCFVLATAVGPATAAQTKALTVNTDFSSATFSWIDLDTRTPHPDVTTVGYDPFLRWYEGYVYVVNRGGPDNIQELDASNNFQTVFQFSTGNGTNPQDIAFLTPHKAYVPRYDSTSLLICDPTNGATLGTISLAAFADADGLPEMAHVALVRNRLFVAVQRLDRNAGYSPTAFSLVVVVDTDADTVLDCDPSTPGVQGITLTYKNPFTTFGYDRSANRLYIGCTGAFGVADGGVEAIDVATLTDLGSVVSEGTLGGDLSDFELWSPTHAYAIVSDASFNTLLVSWNPTTHQFIGTVAAPGGFSLADCAIDDRGELYLANNGFSAPGLYVYRAGLDTLIAGPIATGQVPVQISFDEARGEVAGVPVPRVAATAFSNAWPNPASRGVQFTLALSRAGDVRVEAFDLSGRRLRTLANGARGAGVTNVAWDLTDAAGRRVAPGVYLIRAEHDGARETRRVVVTR